MIWFHLSPLFLWSMTTVITITTATTINIIVVKSITQSPIHIGNIKLLNPTMFSRYSSVAMPNTSATQICIVRVSFITFRFLLF